MCDHFICKYISLPVYFNKSCEYCIFYDYDETGSVGPQAYCSKGGD